MPRGVYPTNKAPKGLRCYPQPLVEAVTYLYELGATQREVGEITRLSQRVVWRLMRNHGLTARKAAKRNQRGPRNPSWKGNSAGYQAFHLRVYTLRGKPMSCSRCGLADETRWYHWANLTGHYENVADYIALCVPCHSRLDARRRKEVPNA